MKSFGSLGELALHLIREEVTMHLALDEGLDKALNVIQRTAESEIGHYQSEVGPFQDWAELAESTEAQKAAQGYPSGAPLLASGEMQGSFDHVREGLEGIVGSNDQKLVYHEFGTSKMPPRPVLGPAAYRNKEAIQKLVGAAALAGLIGGDQIHAALGYDMEVG